ncbi:3-ketoacyl-CoA synthase 11-like protein [Tanacetum coccineum]
MCLGSMVVECDFYLGIMIEVSAENELKKEVTMVVPNVDGEGHTKQIMSLKFEWKRPQCCECHVFGHSISSCPKCVAVNNAEKIVENDDSFTVVTHKKNKEKKVTNNNDANNGFMLPKPKPKIPRGRGTLQNKETRFIMYSIATWNIRGLNRTPKQFESVLKSFVIGIGLRMLTCENKKVSYHCRMGCSGIGICGGIFDLHKNMVRGKSWVLMGDFNVALNLEDIFSGSSVMNASMIEEWKRNFKELDSCMGKMKFIVEFVGANDFLNAKTARVDWLEAGDANTAYFHKTIKSQTHRSRIEVIRDVNGVEYIGLSVPEAFVNHYKDFLGTDMLCDDMDSTDLFLKQVSKSSYNDMVCDIMNVEIKSAMFDIGDDRAPGPDRFSSTFFKKGWDILGYDVCKSIRIFLGKDRFLEEINHTFNFPFIPEVSIPVLRIMTTFMTCVTSSSFSIGLNGDIHGFFKGKRGLRQGDPLSPYLFMLVVEVLTLMLKTKVRLSNSFWYHHKCKALEIINVCFANDLFIFSRGDVNSAMMIMESLDEFKRVSSLVPSIPKSTVFFCNVGNTMKNEILRIMPFLEGNLLAMYLGVPLISSRLLNWDCKILVEKSKNRIEIASDSYLSPRDITQEGYHLKNAVADLVSNNAWSWPNVWLLKSSNIGQSQTPNLIENNYARFDGETSMGCFTTSQLLGLGMRHSFHMWLVMRKALNTQDKLRMWDLGGVDTNYYYVALEFYCGTQVDSHTLLLIESPYASEVWIFDQTRLLEWNILELNTRLFKNIKRPPEDVRDAIMVTVRLKLLTLRFKNKEIVARFVCGIARVFLVVQALLEVNEGINKARDTVMSDSEDSTNTYTVVSSPFGGLSNIRSPGVDGPPVMPNDPYAYVVAAFQAPPSPDYVSGPKYPPSPDFVPEPVYPEFMPPEDEVLPAKEQLLPTTLSPTAKITKYLTYIPA